MARLNPSLEGPSGCIPWPPWIRDPANCTKEAGFGTIVSRLLPLSEQNPPPLARGRQWDAAAASPWFDYVERGADGGPKRHRVWLGLYPIVTLQYSSTTLYQFSCHNSSCFV
jgi:hypothetical protein